MDEEQAADRSRDAVPTPARLERLRVVAEAALMARMALAREPFPDPIELARARAALDLALNQLRPGDLED